MDFNPWVEKYKPQTLEDCCLTKRNRDMFNKIRESGEFPNMLLSGGCGMGKTATIDVLTKELDATYTKINISDKTGIDTLRTDIKNFASTIDINPDTKATTKVAFLDEFDGASIALQKGLRNDIEGRIGTVRYAMTCNYPQNIIEAIRKSRVITVDFDFMSKDEQLDLMKQVLNRCVHILNTEGIPFDNSALLHHIKNCFPDIRSVINNLWSYSNIYGKIDEGILNYSGGANAKVEEMFLWLKSKKDESGNKFGWTEARKWIDEHQLTNNQFIMEIWKSMKRHQSNEQIAISSCVFHTYLNSVCESKEILQSALLFDLMRNKCI